MSVDGRGLNEGPMTAAYRSLGQQADALLSAIGPPEMADAAVELRRTATSTHQLLTSPSLDGMPVQLGRSGRIPQQRRTDLADLALDTITAIDYLLSLLNSPASAPPRLILEREFDSGRLSSSLVDDFSRLTRQQLDARAAAVRAGTQLTSELYSDLAGL